MADNTVTVVVKKSVAWPRDTIRSRRASWREIDTIVIVMVPDDLFHFGTVIQQEYDIGSYGFCLENRRARIIDHVRLGG